MCGIINGGIEARWPQVDVGEQVYTRLLIWAKRTPWSPPWNRHGPIPGLPCLPAHWEKCGRFPVVQEPQSALAQFASCNRLDGISSATINLRIDDQVSGVLWVVDANRPASGHGHANTKHLSGAKMAVILHRPPKRSFKLPHTTFSQIYKPGGRAAERYSLTVPVFS